MQGPGVIGGNFELLELLVQLPIKKISFLKWFNFTDHQTVVSSLKIKEGKISKANTNAENTKNNNQNKEIPNMEFNPTVKSKTQIANENKKDSSEEGANEGYSYVSGQANLKPKVFFYKHFNIYVLTRNFRLTLNEED